MLLYALIILFRPFFSSFSRLYCSNSGDELLDFDLSDEKSKRRLVNRYRKFLLYVVLVVVCRSERERSSEGLKMWGFEITKHSFYYTMQTFGPHLLVQTFCRCVRRLQTFSYEKQIPLKTTV
ncbi:hypothetical protein Hanom_Chr09g00770251 [Helianthus anomalus]